MTETGLILGQEKIHDKTNEIPIFQQMLEFLNVKGKILTSDAICPDTEKNQPELFDFASEKTTR